LNGSLAEKLDQQCEKVSTFYGLREIEADRRNGRQMSEEHGSRSQLIPKTRCSRCSPRARRAGCVTRRTILCAWGFEGGTRSSNPTPAWAKTLRIPPFL